MSIVNGGYAKVRKQIFEISLSVYENDVYVGAMVDFQYVLTRREAIAYSLRAHPTAKLAGVFDEMEMSPGMLEQAREWLFQPRPSTTPSRCEPLLDRG